MGKIIQLKAIPKQVEQPLLEHTGGRSYTRQEMVDFDYRGTWETVKRHKPKLIPSLSVHQVKPMELAQGALIALYMKNDDECAYMLSHAFVDAVDKKMTSIALNRLPEFIRGYVWSYNLHFLYRARAEIEHCILIFPQD